MGNRPVLRYRRLLLLSATLGAGLIGCSSSGSSSPSPTHTPELESEAENGNSGLSCFEFSGSWSVAKTAQRLTARKHSKCFDPSGGM